MSAIPIACSGSVSFSLFRIWLRSPKYIFSRARSSCGEKPSALLRHFMPLYSGDYAMLLSSRLHQPVSSLPGKRVWCNDPSEGMQPCPIIPSMSASSSMGDEILGSFPMQCLSSAKIIGKAAPVRVAFSAPSFIHNTLNPKVPNNFFCFGYFVIVKFFVNFSHDMASNSFDCIFNYGCLADKIP